MNLLPEQRISCPYCGEVITVLIDDNGEESYVEDCQVCCQPIVFCREEGADGAPTLWARREDE